MFQVVVGGPVGASVSLPQGSCGYYRSLPLWVWMEPGTLSGALGDLKSAIQIQSIII